MQVTSIATTTITTSYPYTILTTVTNSTTSYITEYHSTTIVSVSTYDVTTTSDVTVSPWNFQIFHPWKPSPRNENVLNSFACAWKHSRSHDCDVLMIIGSYHHHDNINIRQIYLLYHHKDNQHVLSLHRVYDNRQWLHDNCYHLHAYDCPNNFNL